MLQSTRQINTVCHLVDLRFQCLQRSQFGVVLRHVQSPAMFLMRWDKTKAKATLNPSQSNDESWSNSFILKDSDQWSRSTFYVWLSDQQNVSWVMSPLSIWQFDIPTVMGQGHKHDTMFAVQVQHRSLSAFICLLPLPSKSIMNEFMQFYFNQSIETYLFMELAFCTKSLLCLHVSDHPSTIARGVVAQSLLLACWLVCFCCLGYPQKQTPEIQIKISDSSFILVLVLVLV